MASKRIQVERLEKLLPRDYQDEAIQIMRNNPSRGVLLADDLGLGKTLMIVERCRTLTPAKGGLRVLWIGPPPTHISVKKTFLRQFRTLPEDKVRLVGPHSGSGTKYDDETWRRMKKKESGIFIISPELAAGRLGSETTASGKVRKIAPNVQNLMKGMRDGRIPPWNLTGEWDLVVFDEVHRVCNRKNTLIGKVLRRIKAVEKIGASATPAGNNEDNLWAVANWLWGAGEYPSYWKWVKEHFRIEEDEFGWDAEKRAPKVAQVVCEPLDPEKLWNSFPCVIRRLAENVLSLPPVIEHEVEVGMTRIQAEMYDDFEEQCFTWMNDVPVGTPLPITKQMRLRQLAMGETNATEFTMTTAQAARRMKVSAESLQLRIDRGEDVDLSAVDIDFNNIDHPKILALKQILEDLPENEPVLVLTSSSKFADIIAKKLGRQSRRWPGASQPELQESLKKGLGTDYRVLIAVISGIGTGTDGLQEKCCVEVWMSQDTNGVNNEQARGRLNRSGQTRPVQRYYLRTTGTVDEDIFAKQFELGQRMAALYGDDKAPGQQAR